MLDRRSTLAPADAGALTREFLTEERQAFESIASFGAIPDSTKQSAGAYFQRLETLTGTPTAPARASGDGATVFARNAAVTGPMVVFGYDYLADHTAGHAAPKLLDYEGLRGGGGEYSYEVLNFVDGKRTVREIRDAVSAEYGPVELALVAEYLRALESAGVVKAAK
jgi:aminopeptidase YwaD